jgi:hypothetical protein
MVKVDVNGVSKSGQSWWRDGKVKVKMSACRSLSFRIGKSGANVSSMATSIINAETPESYTLWSELASIKDTELKETEEDRRGGSY